MACDNSKDKDPVDSHYLEIGVLQTCYGSDGGGMLAMFHRVHNVTPEGTIQEVDRLAFHHREICCVDCTTYASAARFKCVPSDT